MATPPAASETSTLEKVREELTCAICTELFTNPKTLSCLHTFCEECLVRSESSRRKRLRTESPPEESEIECPQCRHVTSHGEGVVAIQTNFTYSNLVAHIKFNEKVNDSELRCGRCKDDVHAPAVAVCYTCGEALCTFCHEMHQRSRELASHSFCTLTEARAASQENAPPPVKPRSYLCSKHSEELKWYCYTCSQVICRDCTVSVKEHREHSFEFIGEVIADEKEGIRSQLSPLAEMLKEVKEGEERVVSEIERLKEIQERRVESIDKSINDSIAVLEERRSALRGESDKIFKHKSKNLSQQLDQLEQAHAAIASVMEFTSTTLEKGSDVEVMMYKGEMLARSDTLQACHGELPLKVTEDDNVRFVFEAKFLRTLGKLCEAPCTEKCVMEGESVENPEIFQGVTNTLTVTAHGSKGQRLVHGGGSCVAEVTCIPETTNQLETVLGSVADNNDGTYSISYTPKYPGLNKVNVKFGEEHIPGSPLQVNVRRNFVNVVPEPHIFTIPNASPWGLAMLSDTEIAISASDCLIHIYSLDGSELETVSSDFTRPYGITCDTNRCIWITDRETHNVMKFGKVDGNWKRILKFGHRGVNAGQFSHPRGLAVHPTSGHIYVADMKNNRIQVFKPDSPVPKYHAQFGSPGKSPGCFNLPAGMCFDRNEHLVVCDDHNCRLQVFNAEGQFLHTLGTTSTEKGLLCSPIGVCSDVYGRYIVTEFGSHCVSFLSPEGTILSCVRTVGQSYGQFVHPRGVTVNRTGYVYVADNENMRVVKF